TPSAQMPPPERACALSTLKITSCLRARAMPSCRPSDSAKSSSWIAFLRLSSVRLMTRSLLPGSALSSSTGKPFGLGRGWRSPCGRGWLLLRSPRSLRRRRPRPSRASRPPFCPWFGPCPWFGFGLPAWFGLAFGAEPDAGSPLGFAPWLVPWFAGGVADCSLAGAEASIGAGAGATGVDAGRSAGAAAGAGGFSAAAFSAALAAALRRGARLRGSGLPSVTGLVSTPLASGGVWLSVSDTGNPRRAPLNYRREGVRRAEGARGQDCPDGRDQSSTRCVSA